PDPLAIDTTLNSNPHKKRKIGAFNHPPRLDFQIQLRDWFKKTLDAQTIELNTAFQTAIIKATAPLVKKIEQLEKVNISLEAKLIALKDATSSQTNKINKINSVSEHIKKKLTTNTPANTADD